MAVSPKKNRFVWLVPLLVGLLGPQLVTSLAFSSKRSSPTAANQNAPLGSESQPQRRNFLATSLQSLVLSFPLLTASSNEASAVITDETDTFADNWWSSAKEKPDSSSGDSVRSPHSTALASDEVVVNVSKKNLKQPGSLGLELGDVEFRTNRRVFVRSVQANSLAFRLGIRPGWVIVALNGQSTERTNAQGVAQMLSTAVRASGDAVVFTFRNPAAFRQQLENLSADQPATTQLAPAGDTTQRNANGSVKSGRSVTQQAEQKMSVSQLVPPKLCTKGATTDDLLEVSYMGTVVETGEVFDGSAIKINGQGIPGRGDDVSLYFVLGKQPFGQFPPGWDVALVGMCVGERRRVIIPPAMAYGSIGIPKRNIPPNATLQYDITLVSVNGISTPQ